VKLARSQWGIAGLAGAAATGGLVFALTGASGNQSQVLGEKITGSGTSTAAPVTTSSANGNSNGNGNGNGNKTFTISGSVSGLYPGGTVQLQLHVATTENQDMTVTKLSATQGATTKRADNPPPGTCAPILTIGSWTGSPFTLPKNTPDLQTPGSISVTLSQSAPDACQGATFNLIYSGTAVQK
jgi:hypothetical protein